MQRKITEIEADILFDREGAQTQWTEIYNSLLKDASERKRLQLPEDTLRAQKALSNSPETTPVENNGKADADAEDLGVDMLAGLFCNTDVRIDDKDSTLEEQTFSMRDFGKFNGLKPRRVLEEACKARYGGILTSRSRLIRFEGPWLAGSVPDNLKKSLSQTSFSDRAMVARAAYSYLDTYIYGRLRRRLSASQGGNDISCDS